MADLLAKGVPLAHAGKPPPPPPQDVGTMILVRDKAWYISVLGHMTSNELCWHGRELGGPSCAAARVEGSQGRTVSDFGGRDSLIAAIATDLAAEYFRKHGTSEEILPLGEAS